MRAIFLGAVLSALSPAICDAQGGWVLRGRVLVDSSEVAIGGDTVILPTERIQATTDSLGRFRMNGIPEGRFVVLVRRIGFRPITSQLIFREGDSLDVDFLLVAVAQTLPDVRVATTLTSRKLEEFEERRRFGIGHFLDSADIAKRGFHTQQTARQRYECRACGRQFDDLTDTIFEGHHQPLKVWVVCLYLIGLNLSNQQIAAELDLNESDAQVMTTQLREGVVAKKSRAA